MLSFLFYLFIIIGTINLVHFGFYLVGANLYDIQYYKRLNSARSKKRQRARNPLISVLIPAYNEELVIERCLDSLRQSSYKKIEVIVCNDASSDKTAALIRNYSRKYPSFLLRLVSRRHNAGKASGLNYIGRRYSNGELIMTLDADSLLEKDALKNVVKYFDDPAVAGVAANVRIIEESSVLGILQRFEHLVSYRSKKFYTITNCELIIGGVASTYRHAVVKKVGYYDTDTVTEDIGLSIKIAAHGNKAHRLLYAADVAAMTEGVADFKTLLRQRYRWKLGNLQNIFKYRHMFFSRNQRYTKSLTYYRFPMAFLGELLLLLEPISFSYILYLTIHFYTLALLVGAYMTITAYLLLIIWPDEHLSWRGKIKSSLLAPSLYFIFYLMNVVQLISIIRCLQDTNIIFRLRNTENTWMSPTRVGKVTSFS